MTFASTVGLRTRSTASRALALATVVTLAFGGAVVGVAAPAMAAPETWTVTSTSDNGLPASCAPGSTAKTPVSPVTLRDAICAANNRGNDATTITLQSGEYRLDEANGSLKLGTRAGSRITLTGPTDRSAVIRGDGKTSVLVLDPNLVGGVSTTIDGLTVTGGVGDEFGGGGIVAGSAGYQAADALTINNSLITGNRVKAGVTHHYGGGVQFIGGALTITDSEISDNDAGTSGGGGVAYQSTGVAGESFTIERTVFDGNKTRSTGTADSNPNTVIGGGAIYFSGSGVTGSITDSSFAGNTVTGNPGAAARGGAIYQEAGTLEVRRNSFTGNVVAGAAPGDDSHAGAALHTLGGVLNAHYNSFEGNTSSAGGFAVAHGVGGLAPVNATVNAGDNWWGCNLSAGPVGCDTASPGVVAPTALELVISPAALDLPSGTMTGALTATLTSLPGGATLPAGSLALFSRTPLAWTLTGATAATLSAPTSLNANGVATASLDTHGQTGALTATARFGKLTLNTPVVLRAAPRFTTPDTASAEIDTASTITVRTTGYPVPALPATVSGVPTGMSYLAAADGTATISGTPTVAGTYTVQLTATAGGATANQALTITVAPAKRFTSADAATFVAGTAGSFPVTAVGSPLGALTMAGELPAGLTLSGGGAGQDTAMLSGTPGVGTGGSHSLVFSRSAGGETITQIFTLTVNEAPRFTSPAAQTVTVGSAVDLRFALAGSHPGDPVITLDGDLPAGLSTVSGPGGVSGLRGTPLPGTGKTYALQLTATNGAGLTATQAVTLTVNEAPYVITPPAAVTVLAGSQATFTVAVGGYPSPSGHWQLSRDGLSWTDLGETGRTLNVATTQADNGSRYRYFINPVLASQSALLTVGTGPAIGSANATRWSVDGSAQEFEVFASGVPDAVISVTPLAPTTLPSWMRIGQSSGGRLTVDGTPPAGSGGIYSLVVSASNDFGTTAASALTITVEEAPTIAAPTSVVLPRGVAVTGVSSVVASGGHPASSELVLDGSSSVPDGLVLTRAGTGDSYALSGTPTASGEYRLVFTARNSATGPSSTVTIPVTVTAAPVINVPATAELAVGSSESIPVTVVPGFPTATQVSIAPQPGFALHQTLAGGYELSIDATVASGIYPIVLSAHNVYSSAPARHLEVTVRQAPQITTQPAGQTATAGTDATFTADATAAFPTTGVLSAQWQRSGDGSTWTDVAGGSLSNGTARLSVRAVQAQSGALYRVVFIDGVSTASESATLTVVTPAALKSAASAGFAVGVANSFTVTATGTPTPQISAAGVPGWLSFTDNGDGTATIVGTPPAGSGGVQTLDLTADNAVGAPATQSLELVVSEKPAFTSPETATITVGATAAITVTSSPGHSGAVTLAVKGALPTGVTFADNGDGTAAFSGTPKAGSGGEYALTLTARNTTGASTQAFTLAVQEAPAFGSGSSAAFTRGVSGSFTVDAASGYPTSVALSVAGALPAGLAFADAGDGTASISGSSTDAAGDYPVTLTATNGAGLTATQTLTIRLAAVETPEPPASVPTGSGSLEGVSPTAGPGASLHLVAAGYAPESPVVFVIYSTPTTLATVTADADGIARATVTIPRGLTGTHSIVSIGVSPTGAELILRSDIVIAADDGTDGGTPPGGGTDGGGTGTGGAVGKPAPGTGGVGTGLSLSGFEGGALALGALALLLLGAAVSAVAVVRRRRSPAND